LSGICYFKKKLRQTTQKVPITIATDNSISIVKKMRAIPRTWENDVNGNNLLSTGSHAIGLLTRLLINLIVSQEKKIDNIINEER
jgi:hypothetical protein